ncbi:MAG TPA: cob(I)yrinic acid a,c-diamide adenosyltransferase [Pirellulales bacterium]|nr:cob(I)yrinic acid a,c-diamide adenosyltransferase [Pirellulales bacterium]
MKIYTKTGDRGETGLFGGPRVGKDHPRVEAYGDVDELNAFLGLVRCEPLDERIGSLLANIQNELFDLGAELASPDPEHSGTKWCAGAEITRLESAIDEHEAALTPLKAFILPGGVRSAALLHVARTICRRAERRVVTLSRDEDLSDDVVVYLNRLGDLLFVLARVVNHSAGCGDVPWESALARKRGASARRSD